MMMTTVHTIAIDGPAASGKSTLGKRLADWLGYLFFDTGVMYRAVTYKAISGDLDVNDERAVTQLAEEIQIDVKPPSADDGRTSDVWADGEDITWDIRTPEVEAYVSLVSAYAGVRQAMAATQRKIGLRGRVVMVGRDIGTVVLPEADVKIYLEASVEERADAQVRRALPVGGTCRLRPDIGSHAQPGSNRLYPYGFTAASRTGCDNTQFRWSKQRPGVQAGAEFDKLTCTELAIPFHGGIPSSL